VKKAAKVRARDEIDSQIYENIAKIEKKKNKAEVVFVIGVLKGHFVFYNLAETEL
jgi:hypoxanthine-guanine phosphoribosyltransferase